MVDKKQKGFFNLEQAYKYTLKALPRGKNYSHQIQNICNIPHNTVTIDNNLNCLLCICDGWLPIPVGKVFDFKNLDEVFNNDMSRIIQTDVDEKKFTWCAIEHCGIKQSNLNKSGYTIVINIDRSCNLACPSCRRENYIVTDGEVFNQKQLASEIILSWIDQVDNDVYVIMSGDGDPLASLTMRPIIKNWKKKPNHHINLKTNGLLIKKQLRDTEIFNSIEKFSISIDAGSKSVYEKVRLGGKWEMLLDNLDFLRENNKQNITELLFTIQNQNYQDLQNFVDLCEKYKFRGIVTQLDDWGTWNTSTVVNPDMWTLKNGYFFEHNVLDKGHENYRECKSIVQQLIDTPFINVLPAVKERLEL